MIYVFLYLSAIVLANLFSAWYGVAASYANAFFFIGFDLLARDKLHEAWSRRGLVWKMGLLIAAGSLITWVLNRNAGNIALASLSAFSLAAVADTVVYHLLHKRDYFVKVNWSNSAGALVDSYVFPTMAFGFSPVVTLGQFVLKVSGGALWAYLLKRNK